MNITWEYRAVLHNIHLPTPLDTEYISIAPDSDPRVNKYLQAFPKAKHLIHGFCDEFQRKRNVSVLLLNKASPKK